MKSGFLSVIQIKKQKFFAGIISLILIMSLISIDLVFAQNEPKPILAVLTLKGLGVSELEAIQITQFLQEELFYSGRYVLVERNQVDKVLQESQYQQSGICDISCAVNIGKQLAAAKVIIGTVGKLESAYTIQIQLIEVETNRLEMPASIQAECRLQDLPDYIGQLVTNLTSPREKTIQKILEETKKPADKPGAKEPAKISQEGGKGPAPAAIGKASGQKTEKKFPWLIVGGVSVAAIIVAVILLTKKKTTTTTTTVATTTSTSIPPTTSTTTTVPTTSTTTTMPTTSTTTTTSISGKTFTDIFNDNFESGILSARWQIWSTGVSVSSENKKNGNYSLKLYDNTSSDSPQVTLDLNTNSSRVGIEFYEWTNDLGWSGGSGYELSTTPLLTYSGWSFVFGAQAYTSSRWKYINDQNKSNWQGSNLWETKAVDFPTPVNAENGAWHKIRIEIYGPEGKAKFWWDDQYKGEISIMPTTSPIRYFSHSISWSTPTGTTNYVDDFKAFTISQY